MVWILTGPLDTNYQLILYTILLPLVTLSFQQNITLTLVMFVFMLNIGLLIKSKYTAKKYCYVSVRVVKGLNLLQKYEVDGSNHEINQ